MIHAQNVSSLAVQLYNVLRPNIWNILTLSMLVYRMKQICLTFVFSYTVMDQVSLFSYVINAFSTTSLIVICSPRHVIVSCYFLICLLSDKVSSDNFFNMTPIFSHIDGHFLGF